MALPARPSARTTTLTTTLLSAEDERQLAAAIRRARRAAAAAVPAGDGEAALRVAEAITGGLDARHRLVTANIGWVTVLARRAVRAGVMLDELVQAGAIGLMVAAETFDPDRGRFTTHATFAVRDEIRAAAEQSTPGWRVRLGVRREAALVAAARDALRSELGAEPSAAQIAKVIGLPETVVLRVAPVMERPVSLDALPADLMLRDDRAEVEATVLAHARAVAARRLLGTLPERESQILRLRFGIEGGDERNRAEVGRLLALSRERVRQIEQRAFEMIRAAAADEGLTELIES